MSIFSLSDVMPDRVKSLVFCRNIGSLMENHRLETRLDKKCAQSSSGNTAHFIQPICSNLPIIWDIFEPSSHFYCPCISGMSVKTPVITKTYIDRDFDLLIENYLIIYKTKIVSSIH